MTKEEFLERYNQPRTIDEALSKSINAAVQHNRIYNKVPNVERNQIRIYWANLLKGLANRYNDENWTETIYEGEILNLKEAMNLQFQELIDFRISHSQKSISVFFKHLWCMDEIPVPPQCPVDRIILTRANAPYNQRSWGFVNDIQTHREKYEIISQASILDGFDNVSIWELENFE